jgi:hypothetical protein
MHWWNTACGHVIIYFNAAILKVWAMIVIQAFLGKIFKNVLVFKM